MTKRGKIVIALSVCASLIAGRSCMLPAIIICKRIYEKNYFSVTD